MDIKTVRINEFPRGAWCVRWLGKTSIPQHTKEVTPKIRVWIQRLSSPEASLFLNPMSNSDDLKHIEIGVGSIPSIAIGSIFLDGTMVDEVDSELVDFTCNTEDFEFRCCADDIIPWRPAWWNDAYPYKAIAKSEFPLGEYSRTPCSVFLAEHRTFVTPEHEIFRASYAASSSLAIALLSKPWDEDSRGEFIDLENSRIDGCGRVTTILRSGIKGLLAPVLFNLTQNSYGLYCAKSIYLGRKSGYVSAPMPFKTQNLKITAKAIRINPRLDKYLILRITRISWPHDCKPRDWHVAHENLFPGAGDESPEDKTRGNKNVPPTNRPRKSPEERISIVEGEDPNQFGAKITITGPAVEWTNIPTYTKASTTAQKKQKPRRKNRRYRVCSEVSTGKPKAGKSDAGKGECESIDPSSVPLASRIQQIKSLMQDIRQHKRIINTSSATPRNQSINRNTSIGWPLRVRYAEINSNGASIPNASEKEQQDAFTNWSYIDKSNKIFRCATIYKIAVKDCLDNPDNLYWVEIEPREKERRFCAFLAYFPNEERASINDIFDILRIIAVYKGNSQDILKALKWKKRNGRFFKWKHRIHSIENTFKWESACNAIFRLIDNPDQHTV